jgi:hypothetical protein
LSYLDIRFKLEPILRKIGRIGYLTLLEIKELIEMVVDVLILKDSELLFFIAFTIIVIALSCLLILKYGDG